MEYNQQIPDPLDVGSLIIPEIELNLSDVQLEELQESCSPLCSSEYHGLVINWKQSWNSSLDNYCLYCRCYYKLYSEMKWTILFKSFEKF